MIKHGPDHSTSSQIQSLVDGRLQADELRRVEEHLRSCKQCREAREAMDRLDASLRRLPRVKVRPDFTETLMEKLAPSSMQSPVFRLFEYAAYFFGLIIVGGIMLAVFVATGTVETGRLSQAGEVLHGVTSKLGDTVGTGFSVVTEWLKAFLPFAFGSNSVGISFFIIAAVGLLYAVDRVIGHRFAQRLR